MKIYIFVAEDDGSEHGVAVRPSLTKAGADKHRNGDRRESVRCFEIPDATVRGYLTPERPKGPVGGRDYKGTGDFSDLFDAFFGKGGKPR